MTAADRFFVLWTGMKFKVAITASRVINRGLRGFRVLRERNLFSDWHQGAFGVVWVRMLLASCVKRLDDNRLLARCHANFVISVLDQRGSGGAATIDGAKFDRAFGEGLTIERYFTGALKQGLAAATAKR